jgi:putative phosphoesterase
VFRPELHGTSPSNWRTGHAHSLEMTETEQPKRGLRIFVLADTHNRLPEKVSKLAQDAHEIWHLGDVCAERILDELRAIGPPITLVRGNCDSNFTWPLVVDLERAGLRFRLQHIPPEPRTLSGEVIDVVLHGHTHVPRNERRGNIWFLNPGCVTRPNRGSPASVAWLELADGRLGWRLQTLR